MTVIQKCFVALAALILLGCDPKVKQLVDPNMASELQAQGELLLDVREADDYQELHIPNTKNIPLGRLASRLAELESYKNKTVMVIDHSELRAPRILELLRKAGFYQVFIVKGGMVGWKAAGLPLEKMEMPPQPLVPQQPAQPAQPVPGLN
jgi:rhodanese-related sulfurtransferase